MHPGFLLDGKRTWPPIFPEFSLDHKLMALEDGIKIAWEPRMTGVIADTQDGNSSWFWAAWDRNGFSSTSYKSLQRWQHTQPLVNPERNTVLLMARQQSLWPGWCWQSGEMIATILPVRDTMPCRLHNLPLLLLYLCTWNYFLPSEEFIVRLKIFCLGREESVSDYKHWQKYL